MDFSPSKQRLFIAAGWLATAVIAYSIGSLRAPSPTPPPGGEKASSVAGVTVVSESREGDDAGLERPLDGAHGALGRSLPEIVGNQSLGDYLKRILGLDDDIKRTTAFLEVLETLKTPEQIREALEAVVKSGRGWGRGASSREFSMLLQKWTGIDPSGAAEYALKATGREERYMAMSNVLRTWTRLDPHAALAWAEANGHAAATDSGAQRDESEGNLAVAMVASRLAQTDLDLALRAAGTDANSRTMARLGDNLAEELYKQRGEAAARETILAMPESKLRDSMMAEHADRLAKTDGPAAAKWATTLPAGPGRSRALAEAVAGWAEQDPTSAGNFLNSMPPSTDSDAARERFAREVLSKDPLGAISWAGTITDPGERQNTTESLVRSWVRRDAASAKTWVMQSTFSAETKQRLLSPDSGRGRN